MTCTCDLRILGNHILLGDNKKKEGEEISHSQGEENLGEITGQGIKGDTTTVTADTEQDHNLQEDVH